MAGDRYFIEDQHGVHFLTFTVVEWIDVFTRKEYKQIIVDSLLHHPITYIVLINHTHV
jgi:hypothetical protein